MVTTMAAVSLTQQQHQQFVDRISRLEARMATLQTHADAQQEQIRMAEVVIQQLRANPANPSPPLRAAFQKPVAEGGASKALTTGNHSEYHDWSFSARRVLTRADERFAGVLQWISGQIDEVKENDGLEYRRTTDLSSTDMDWLNSELYALLAIKTTDTAMAAIKSLEEEKVKGIIWLATPGARGVGISSTSCGTSHQISDPSGKSAECQSPTGFLPLGK